MKQMFCHLISEQVGPQGGVVADVMTNSISTSAYTQTETFLREMLQNSCDQRKQNGKSISFLIDVTHITGKEKEFLNLFLKNVPGANDILNIREILSKKSVEAIIVSDKGTVGLAGPVDASIDSDQANFSGFFFNVGRPSTESSSGGSFGLGRTVLTNASRYSTVLVYSQFLEKNKLQSRFMGMAIAGAYSLRGRKFTGRHWLGIADESNEGSVLPFESSEAIDIAESLGVRSILGTETGFVAIVLGNRLITEEGGELERSAQRADLAFRFQQAAYHYGWPHMIKKNGQPSVNFSFKHSGELLPMNDPVQIPVVRDFVACYQAQEKPNPLINLKEIFFTKSVQKIQTGILSWYTTPIDKFDEELDEREIIGKSSIALIRQANFVVKYLSVIQPSDGLAVRGVFKTNSDFDSIFRKSEPVAHDDWVPTKLQLPPLSRNPVKQTLESIRGTFKGLELQNRDVSDGEGAVFLGNVVGRLLDGLQLTGQKGGSKSGVGGKGRNRAKSGFTLEEIGTPVITASNTKAYSSQFKYRILVSSNSTMTQTVTFKPASILENGSLESTAPIGAVEPVITKLSLNGEVLHLTEPVTIVPENNNDEIIVEIRNSQGVATACKYEVRTDA
jgi:hypothetical protein